MDALGNVNVSNFAGRVPGVGGFADIASNAKTLVFTTTLTCGNLVTKVEGGKLIIVQEGSIMKTLGLEFFEYFMFFGCGCGWAVAGYSRHVDVEASVAEVQADHR